jgi:Bacterial Ig-like domain (group 3)/Beta-propeller repeat
MTPTPSKSALHCLSTLAFFFAGTAAAQTPVHPRPANLHTPKVDADFGKLPLSFEPNRGQTDPTVQFLARGSRYTVLLQSTAATLVLSREDGTRHTGRPAPVIRASVRMTLNGANPRAAMSPDRPLPGYVNYISGDKAQTHTGIPTYAATRAASVYPGIDLVYYGTGRQLEYDFVVSPESDPSLIHLAIDGARPVVESNGDLRLQIGATSRETDLVFHKPVLYQQIDGARHSIDGAFTVAANNEVGFKIGAYDRSKELVIDPVIGYGSYYGGNGEDEINGSALNASNQLYIAGQTLSTSLPSTSAEFQTGPVANNNGHDGFVSKFSADGSSVLWTTYLSGSADDFATAVAVNASDQAYVVGYTNSCQSASDPGSSSTSVRFPFTSDAIQPLCSPTVIGADNYESDGGNYTTFLVKLSSDGKTLLYGTPIGGSSNDFASSIVLDSTGRPYIVGETSSTAYSKCATVGPHCGDVPSYPVDQHGNAGIGIANYPTTSNAFYSSTTESQMYPTVCIGCPETQDEQAFITILSVDLHSFVYSSLIGGPDLGGCGNGACNTNGFAVAVNAAGQAFIGGNTSSAHWPTTAGSFSPTCSNAGAANSTCPLNGWLAAFDPTKSGAASLLFSTYMNGTSGGLDFNGNPLFPGSDVYGLAVDSKGNVVATGDTGANNFPTTSGTFGPVCTQFGDGNGNSKRCNSAFVTKLSPTGATVWSTYFGPMTQPGNFVIGNGIALDANDNVFVVGTSTSPTLPLIHPISTNPGQYSDALVFELSPTGSTELMGTYIGAIGITVDNNSLHLDSKLNAYFSGSIHYSTNGIESFPATPGSFSATGLGGSADGWAMKLVTQQQLSTTALQITPTAGAPGTSIGFTATVTGVIGFAVPTGTVTLTNGSTTLGTITLANGTGTFSTTTLAAGTYSVIATYSGDVVYATSATTAQTVTIQNTPTVALTATPSTATIGTAVALKATVASSAGTPTGTVFFMDGTNTLGSATLVSGVASYSATALAVGSHSITARYSGDSNFVAINSAAQIVTINLITPTIALTATPATAAIGTAIALGATVTGAGASPAGTVRFLDGATTLATINPASGAASYSASALAVGTHTITASYSGDANFAALVSAAQTVTITAIPPSITAAFSPASLTIVHGSTGTSTLTVTPANGFAGTLNFSCGSLPSSASCGFAPAALTFTAGSSAPQTSLLTFSTSASIIGALRPAPFAPHGGSPTGPVFAALLLLPLAFTRRGRRILRAHSATTLALCLCALVGLGIVSGCGGSNTTAASTTPVGNYTISIAVAGAPSATALNLQITVQ